MRSSRRAPVVLAAISVLILSACGANGSREANVDDIDVTITGDGADRAAEFTWGGEPFAEIDEPFNATETQTRILNGAGAAGAGSGLDTGEATGSPTDGPDDGPDRMLIDYAILNGTSGQIAVSTLGHDPVAVDVGPASVIPPGMLRALEGAESGTTLLTSMPPADGFGPNGVPEAGIAGGDSIVVYLEVHDVYSILTAAQGTTVDPVDGLPTVEADGASPAEVTVPEGEDPPTELVAQLLVEGEGPVTEPGDNVSVHYTGVNWETGEQFDSSLTPDRGQPFVVDNLGSAPVIDGWNEGLQGLPVGSRVLLVLPPDLAYGELPEPAEGEGDEASETAAPQQDAHPLAGQTLIFVVDILDAS